MHPLHLGGGIHRSLRCCFCEAAAVARYLSDCIGRFVGTPTEKALIEVCLELSEETNSCLNNAKEVRLRVETQQVRKVHPGLAGRAAGRARSLAGSQEDEALLLCPS